MHIKGGVMRALVDMNEDQVEALDALAKQAKTSRAALIRDAIDAYLDRHRRRHAEDGFGLWGRRDIDGLAYQERIREEW
jgi:metal-responsive CopG/Arc/MetJ family transcriptional regulator